MTATDGTSRASGQAGVSEDGARRAAEIDSVMVGDDAGGAYTGLSFARHIQVLVRAEDLDQAKTILSETGMAPAPAPDDAEPTG